MKRMFHVEVNSFKMKRKFILMSINCILLAGLLCGCNKLDVKGLLKNITSESDDEDDEYITVSWDEVNEEAERVSKLAYDAIESRNSEDLKALFAPYTAENCDLDEEIAAFFKKIDGNIISVKETSGFYSGGNKDAMKGGVFNEYRCRLINLKTDTGCSYEVKLLGVYNYDGSEEKEGINAIFLYYPDDTARDSNLAEIGDVVKYGYEHQDEHAEYGGLENYPK